MSLTSQDIYEQIVAEFGFETRTFVDISSNEIAEHSNLSQRIPVYELESLGRVILGDLTNEPSQACNLNLNQIERNSEVEITCPPSSPISENRNSPLDFNLSGIEDLSFSLLNSSNITNLEELNEVLLNSNDETSSTIVQPRIVVDDTRPSAESETLTVENIFTSGNDENANNRVKKKKRVKSSEEDKENSSENLYTRLKSRRKSAFNPISVNQKPLEMCQICKKFFKRLNRHRCQHYSNGIVNEIIESPSSAADSTSVVARPETKSKPLTDLNGGEAKLQVKKKKRTNNKENLNVSNMYTRLKKRQSTLNLPSKQLTAGKMMCIKCKKFFKRMDLHRCKLLM